MISSEQVSQLFAQQTGGFAGQNAYANTIGISNPALQLGSNIIGGGGMVPGGPAYPGMPAPPPVFSYAHGGVFGPGGGLANRVTSGTMAGMGALATGAGVGLGLASWLGPLKPIAPFIDPISGFMAAGPKIPWLNPAGTGTVMSGLAGAIPGLAVAGAASMAMGSFMSGAHQQSAITNQLGQFGFMNPASRTGVGFSRQDAAEIGQGIRQLAIIPDMLTNVQELTRLLPRLRSMGVMQGVRDASEFQAKFKETITTIREMSRMLGTTMEEAAQFFEHSRLSGFGTKPAQLKNLLNVQFTSGFTGMTMGQTMGLQMQGATFARQVGARGRVGAEAALGLSNRLQAALEGKRLDHETLLDLTGMEGPEAVGAGGLRLQGELTNLMRGTAVGQLMMAGLMTRDKEGRLTVDKDALADFNRGVLGQEGLKKRVAGLSGADKMLLKGPQGANLAQELAGSANVGQFLRQILGGRPMEAAPLVLKNLNPNLSDAAIESIMALGGGASGGLDQEQFQAIRQREIAIRERFDPTILWQKVKTSIRAKTTEPFAKLGSEVYSSLSKSVEEFVDDIVGRYSMELTADSLDAFKKAMIGGGDKELKEMWAASAGLQGKGGSSSWSPGRVFKMGAMLTGGTVVGIGASIVGTPVAGMAAGGATALGIGAAMGPWTDELDASIRSFANPGVTGRTPAQERAYQARLYGVPEVGWDTFQAGLNRNAFKTAQGEAAAGAYAELRAEAAAAARAEHGPAGWETAQGEQRQARTTQAFYSKIAAARIRQLGVTDTGAATRLREGIIGALSSGDDDRIKFMLGADLPTWAEGQGDEKLKKLVRSAASTKRPGMDWGASLNMSAPQDEDDLSTRGAGGRGEIIRQLKNAETATQLRRKAEDGLSFLKDGAASDIRASGAVRKAILAVLGGNDALKTAIESGKPENVLAASSETPLTADQVKAAKNVLASLSGVSPALAREKIGFYHQVSLSSSDLAIASRAEKIGTDIEARALEYEGNEDNKEVLKGLAGAFKGYGASPGGDTFAAMRASVDRLRSAYRAAARSPEERKRLVAAAGAAGSYVAFQEDALARLTSGGGRVTKARVMQELGMDEQTYARATANLSTGQAGGPLNLVGADLERFTANLSGLATTGALGGAGSNRGGHDQQMVESLTKISKNSDLQTSLLATLIEKSSWALSDDQKKALAAVRSNAVDSAGKFQTAFGPKQ